MSVSTEAWEYLVLKGATAASRKIEKAAAARRRKQQLGTLVAWFRELMGWGGGGGWKRRGYEDQNARRCRGRCAKPGLDFRDVSFTVPCAEEVKDVQKKGKPIFNVSSFGTPLRDFFSLPDVTPSSPSRRKIEGPHRAITTLGTTTHH